MMPRIFSGEMASFHEEAWEWYWEVTRHRIAGTEPPPELEPDALMPWGRGLAKSTILEAIGVAEGAFLGRAFIVYISSTAEKATEHLHSMRAIIESNEIAKYYPGLGTPLIGKFHNQRGWRANRLSTDSGFSAVAAGLKEGIRGLRDETLRPTMILLDDLDERDDSPDVTAKKFEAITRDALPMLAPLGTVIFAQNLIHNQSIMTKTLSGEMEWLLHRRVLGGGIINTYQDDLKIEKKDGRYMITAGTSNWSRVTRRVGQDMLNKFGPAGFRIEAMNDVKPTAEEMVWTGYDKETHVITWSDFERVFGTRKIPTHWKLFAGYDRGNTGEERHPAAVSVAAVAAENSSLPGDVFVFYEKVTNPKELIDDIARDLIQDLGTLCENDDISRAASLVRYSYQSGIEERQAWVLRQQAGGLIPFAVFKGSHEAAGERNTFLFNWNIAVSAGSPSKTEGLAQLHEYLACESKQHPFKPHLFKRPNVYFVVADDQANTATDRFGLKRHRFEAENLKWDRKILHRDVPTKLGDDITDCIKHYFATFALDATPLTREEKIEASLPEYYQLSPESNVKPEGWWQAREHQRSIQEQEQPSDQDDFGKFFS